MIIRLDNHADRSTHGGRAPPRPDRRTTRTATRMTRTRRAYNRSEQCRSPRMRDAYHPWQWRCMGHCRIHRDPSIAPTRRRTYQRLAAHEVAEAIAPDLPADQADDPA